MAGGGGPNCGDDGARCGGNAAGCAVVTHRSRGQADSLPGPWLYPLYYVALLLPRERDDDRRCAAKYGPLWERYRERVPRRILPRVY